MSSTYQHLYPIIDLALENTVHELVEEDVEISCRAGCDHCCYLLIEVTWEEAYEMAKWVIAQPDEQKQNVMNKIAQNAKQARKIFAQYEEGQAIMQATDSDVELPEAIFDDYFYKLNQPCPFLENHRCQAYEVRPGPCRFHLVSSPAENCSRHSGESGEEVEVPEAIDEIKEAFSPVINAVETDPRWGHLAIMVEAALQELEDNVIYQACSDEQNDECIV